MESQLSSIVNKVDKFKEVEGYLFVEPSGLDAYDTVRLRLGEDKCHKMAKYSKQQQALDEKLASMCKDIEYLTGQNDNLKKRKLEVMQTNEDVKNTMHNKLSNLKAQESFSPESPTLRSPATFQISVLLNVITNLDWNLKGCDNSKIEGHLVSRSLLKSFSFNLSTDKHHEVQEKLWGILDDDGFSHSFEN